MMARFRVLHHHADGGIGRVSVALDLRASAPGGREGAPGPVRRRPAISPAVLAGGAGHRPVWSTRGSSRFTAWAATAGAGRSMRCDSSRARTSDGRSKASTRPIPSPGRDPGERALALRQLLRRFVDVCNVVAYAHSRGVLHRDIKPANILLGPYGETLVVDWGMAKLVDGPPTAGRASQEPALGPAGEESWDQTQQGIILGTIPYMSPEQAEGESPGTASDVFSLGATLYHIITGRPPIEKDDKYAMLCRARRGEFTPPRQVNPRVPAALEAVCQKAMSLESGRPVRFAACPRRRDRALAGRRARGRLEGTVARSNAEMGQQASHAGRRGRRGPRCRGARHGASA